MNGKHYSILTVKDYGENIIASHELNIVLGILEETAAKFRELNEEADVFIAGGDAEGYKARLRERAQLIVDLPSRIAVPISALKGNEKPLCFVVKEKLATLAYMAKRAIDTDNVFGMGVLLTTKGDKKGDKNHLEKLIADIKKFG